VNLAPSQFRLANLVDQIRRALDAAALDPQFLEVELTESAVMSDAEESIRILEAVSRMGVLVSVDDFGTGYSSMSYLRRFPIDKLEAADPGGVAFRTHSKLAALVRARSWAAARRLRPLTPPGCQPTDRAALSALQRLPDAVVSGLWHQNQGEHEAHGGNRNGIN